MHLDQPRSTGRTIEPHGLMDSWIFLARMGTRHALATEADIESFIENHVKFKRSLLS